MRQPTTLTVARGWTLAIAGFLTVLVLPATASAALARATPPSPSRDLRTAARSATRQVQPATARQVVIAGIEGSVWGLPPVVMARVRARFLCSSAVNRLVDIPVLSNPSSRLVVTPNVDTLYSSAWLDLRRGPALIRVPEVTGRYYVLQLLDMYTNTFADIGTRATGTAAGTYAVVGPGWHGSVPPGAHRVVAPTPDVWIIGRTLVRGPDAQAAAAVQRNITLVPPDGSAPAVGTPELPLNADCSSTGGPLVPTGPAFFGDLATIVAADPPPARDASVLRDLEPAGIRPGERTAASLTPQMTAMLARGTTIGSTLLRQFAATALRQVHGWTQLPSTGTYGDDYFARALAAQVGLGANIPEESVYYSASVDVTGTRLTGRNGYVLRFAPKSTPPVTPDGFWSITLYGPDHFLVANPEDRYAIGDRTPGLTQEPDGSLDLYIGGQPPPNRQANWLPAPPGRFSLVLRAYLPTAAVRTNRWTPPGLELSG